MGIFLRAAPIRIASPLPTRLIVPVSGTVECATPRLVMTLVSSVTAPFRAKALPHVMLAPEFNVILVSARIFPANAVVVPRVA